MRDHKRTGDADSAVEGIMTARGQGPSLTRRGRRRHARQQWLRHVVWLPILLTMIVVTGCFRPNVRTYIRGDIWLHGGLKYDKSGHREGRYTRLEIGDGEHPIGDVPQTYLEMADGQILFLPDVTESQLAESGWRLTTPQSERESWRQPLPGNLYDKQKCSFLFINSALVQIKMWGGHETDSWTSPILWGSDRSKACQLPLGDQDAADLFGPADRMVDGHFN